MKARIIAAFERVRNGFSVDRVIADPVMNADFVCSCADAGITAAAATLNRTLINLRKAGHLRGIKSNKTAFSHEDHYRFAVEMAARFIERRDGVTLDDVLCDPALAAEFDQIAMRISPGYSSLEYRWAALNLRKTSKLAPELLGRVAPPVAVTTFTASQIDLSRILVQQGIYLFFTPVECLYVGEAESLRNQRRRCVARSS